MSFPLSTVYVSDHYIVRAYTRGTLKGRMFCQISVGRKFIGVGLISVVHISFIVLVLVDNRNFTVLA